MISSALKQTGRFDVSYYDANFYHMTPREILDTICEEDPDYVGFNVTFPNMQLVKDLSDLLKSELPSMKTIVGGPAATLASEYLLRDSSVDFVVLGEGEATIVDLLDALDEGKSPHLVKRIAYKTVFDNKVVKTDKRPIGY